MMLLGLLIVCLFSISTGTGDAAQENTFLINCGSNNITTDANGRVWVGDFSGVNFTLSYPGITAWTPAVEGNSIYQPLYESARVFDSASHYDFNVPPGSYCIRLHFYALSSSNLNANDSVFGITANDLTLVSKFNVPGEILYKDAGRKAINTLVKEYFLYVSSNELQIKFVPDPGSFAFINAIEVIEASNNLFTDSASKVGNKEILTLSLTEHGIETMYRLNVGGPALEPSKDQELWRKWEPDDEFIFSVNAATAITNDSSISYSSTNDATVAPLLVYETARVMSDSEVIEKRFNVSWRFNVDPNFDYLVRLHFCELVYNKQNQRIFRIYINNKTAAEEYDVLARAKGQNKAYHDDFADMVPPQIDTLWLQLGPDSSVGGSGTDAILNGVEIFKLSKDKNLAHVSERTNSSGEGSGTKKRRSKVLWAATGVGASVITISVACVFFLQHVRKRKGDDAKEPPPGWHMLFLHEAMASTTNAGTSKMPLISNGLTASHRLGRRFSLSEIKGATSNFDESLVIGTGGFGKVYRGEIDDGVLVAVKRGNPQSQQGVAEFETEIEMLSKLRHRHLVSMIGYCDEQREMILVYEYMANGTLRSHLYGSSHPPLSWKQRLGTCIGAARGLHYLHTGAERCIIHRDVKTTNILLDGELVAKMADFGLSRAGPSLEHTHVSTAVKGSFGYLDPEYFRRQQLTQKSDVYSFGVVLFEVVCARPVIDPSLPKDQINLAEWALRWQRQRSLESIMDPRLEGDCSLESLKKFGEIAEKCLADDGKNRPTMADVLWHLEYVLHLHEAYRKSGDGDSFGSSAELGLQDISSFSIPFV